jgi:dihydrofolate reductase
VHARAQGDAWFPEYDSNKYQEVARTDHPADERHAFAYSFVTLERR